MKLVGIDPGIRGGLAIVEILNGAAPQLVDAIDIPVAGVGAKERVDAIAIRAWIETHQPQHALIERAQAMPKQGASSGFKYGRAIGAIEAVIACCGIPLTIVEPSVWKKFHHLRGGDKDGRQRALQLFPSAHTLLARKRDHGRAEAALIALTVTPAWNVMKAASMKTREQEQADNACLMHAWRKWHREQVEAALAGVHGVLVAELMGLLDQLKMDSAGALLAFVERTDWTTVDYEVRLELLHQINGEICRMRERHGLPPFDDPIPPKHDSVFRRVKARLLDSRDRGNA